METKTAAFFWIAGPRQMPSRDAEPFEEKFPDVWKSIPHDELRRRMDEVPKDKKLILVCNTGVRSYEAQLDLAAEGIEDTVSVAPGIAGLKECGMKF